MRFKCLIFAIAYLILLSSFAAAQDFAVGDIHAIIDGRSDLLEYKEDIAVKQGSTLRIKMQFQNHYTDEDDSVDVELEGKISDIDLGHDIDEVEDVKVRAGTSEVLFLEFKIPYITEGDDYWLDLDVTAEADNGDDYEYHFRHKIEVNKPQNELIINNLRVSKDVVSCDSTVFVLFDILNTGHTDEDDMRYIIENKGVNIYLERKDLTISEGEIMSVAESINIEGMPVGNHRIYVGAYCNEDETSVVRYTTIKREACGQSPQTSTQQTQTTQTTQPTPPTTQQTTTQQSIIQPTQTFTPPQPGTRVIRESSSILPVLLISIAAIAAYGIIYLAARLLKK